MQLHYYAGRTIVRRMSDPAVLVMISLAEGPKHGYAIQRDIFAFAGVRLGPGTLYGAISRLEERGMIKARAAGGRQKPYELTPQGTADLQDRTVLLRRLVLAADERAV
ncbi:MAG: PadR family transcriptional regulator [Dehalococcoidia bacterium]